MFSNQACPELCTFLLHCAYKLSSSSAHLSLHVHYHTQLREANWPSQLFCLEASLARSMNSTGSFLSSKLPWVMVWTIWDYVPPLHRLGFSFLQLAIAVSSTSFQTPLMASRCLLLKHLIFSYQLCRLILWVNVSEPWDAQIFGQMYSGCVCKGVSGKINIWVDRLKKKDCPLYLSRPRIGLALPRVGRFFLPDCELGHESFPAFGLELKHLGF